MSAQAVRRVTEHLSASPARSCTRPVRSCRHLTAHRQNNERGIRALGETKLTEIRESVAYSVSTRIELPRSLHRTTSPAQRLLLSVHRQRAVAAGSSQRRCPHCCCCQKSSRTPGPRKHCCSPVLASQLTVETLERWGNSLRVWCALFALRLASLPQCV